jgi:hypothetical protein
MGFDGGTTNTTALHKTIGQARQLQEHISGTLLVPETTE